MIPAPPKLTVREMKVVTLIASGVPLGEAARKLGIDSGATSLHHESAMRKLGVTNAAGLKRAAIRMGWIVL